ncbi:MAG: MFS transporter [Chloroflexi bacterium]|nr:MFS transporter [Chloroflexota bacterium]
MLNRLFLAFQSEGYTWLWLAGLLRGFAMITGSLAQGWLILELTDVGDGGSPFWVGAGAGVMGLTILCTAPLGGWVADRFDRRRVLLAIEAITFSASLLLALLILSDVVRLWHVVGLAVANGVNMALGMPARNTLTYDLVGREALLNATAANFTTMSITRMIAPALAGIIISLYGVEWCYFFMTGTSTLAAVCLLRVPRRPRAASSGGAMWGQLKEGLAVAMRPGLMRSLLLMSPVVEVFGFSYNVMLPVMAREVLDAGAAGLGILGSASGVGSFIGAIAVASRGNFARKGLLVVGASAFFGLFLVLFAISPWLYVSAAFVAMAGAMATAYDVSLNTLLQTLAPEDARGRIMGMLVFTYGISPLGGFQAGLIASFVGAPFAIGLGGALLMVNALRIAPLAGRILAWESGAEEKPSLWQGGSEDKVEPGSPL